MSKPACPRLFEVEAMRDGRLTGAERASFERHVASCAACSREAEALEALARAARASATSHESRDELHVRRERTRLLAAFDQALVRGERRPRRWIAPVAGLALAAGALVTWRASSKPPPSAPTASSPPPLGSTVIQADGAALYSKETDGRRERIVLQRGVLRIQVTHPSARDDSAVLVVLPDGELEDLGTTFTVTAADGRTTHVAVEEGSVVLRLRERPPIVLRSGEAWTAELRASPPPPSSAPPSSAASSASSSAPPPVAPPTTPAPHAVTPSPAEDASKDFRDAMSALNAGDHHGAAARFAQFLDAHPRDSRAEDAAYLRVVALHRAGASAEAERKEAARAYLERFPSGFRRAEVARLAE